MFDDACVKTRDVAALRLYVLITGNQKGSSPDRFLKFPPLVRLQKPSVGRVLLNKIIKVLTHTERVTGIPACRQAGNPLNWSGIPESNWRLLLGKQMYCHCTNPADIHYFLPKFLSATFTRSPISAISFGTAFSASRASETV